MADGNDIKTPEQIQASMKAMDEYMEKIKQLAEVEGLLGDSLVGRLESQTIQLHEILDQRHEVRKKNLQTEIDESKKSADYFRDMMEKGTNSNLSQEHLSLLVESNQKAADLYNNIKNLNSEQASMMAKQVDQNYQKITGAEGGTLADPQTPAGAFASAYACGRSGGAVRKPRHRAVATENACFPGVLGPCPSERTACVRHRTPRRGAACWTIPGVGSPGSKRAPGATTQHYTPRQIPRRSPQRYPRPRR